MNRLMLLLIGAGIGLGGTYFALKTPSAAASSGLPDRGQFPTDDSNLLPGIYHNGAKTITIYPDPNDPTKAGRAVVT